MVLLFVVQWLHVLLGVFWLGSTLYVNVILVPALMSLPREKTREVSGQIGALSGKVFTPVGIAVILLGILRGTVFGSVRSIEFAVGTAYGRTWLIALVVTVALACWGTFVIGPAARSLDEAVSADIYAARLARMKAVTMAELLAFAVIFTCMILMRFGY